MTDTIVLGIKTSTGDPVTPPAANLRWGSADLSVVDQKIIDEAGSTETVLAVRNTEAASDGQQAPRIRVGQYVSVEDGVKKYNISIRIQTYQKHTDGNGNESFNDVSFVLAGTTYHAVQADILSSFAELAISLMYYDPASDTTNVGLAAALNDGITTPPNVGEPYTGSVFV